MAAPAVPSWLQRLFTRYAAAESDRVAVERVRQSLSPAPSASGVERRRPQGLVEQHHQLTAQDVLEVSSDALLVVSEAGRIVQFNTATERQFGYSRRELLGLPVELLLPERFRDLAARYREGYGSGSERQRPAARRDVLGLRKDGTEFPIEIALSPLVTARGTLVLASIKNKPADERAGDERRRVPGERALYAEISRLARHDLLTGLPNRALLRDRLASAIAFAHRHDRRLAVLFLDIDRFKHANESLGHAIGDRLLQSVGRRLSASVRETDTVSRQGGDEFVVLLSDVETKRDASAAAAKILGAVSGPHHVAGHELHVTVSIGISTYPEDGEDAETLIKHADIAMYHAKDRGRDSIEFFTNDLNARVIERQSLEASLRGALERREFVLYYQPKVDLATGALKGAEALIRWRHPLRGLVPPGRFVPVAEDTGLIVPIGQWVLREACRQARAWQEAGLEPVPVAVNISGREFAARGFLDGIRRVLEETALDPRLLELELTESVLMESVEATAATLRELKALGIRVAVDDFGTGYSSLSYLLQFPIDALKVDQSFVREITTEDGGSPIISAVISMGKNLKHRVIAEGIETQEQLTFLEGQFCEEGQGYYFSPPLVAEEFAGLLERGRENRTVS